MITALLGLAIFGERLPALWWVGAAGLVVGNVIIGRREEKEMQGKVGAGEGEEGEDVSLMDTHAEDRGEVFRDQEVDEEHRGVLARDGGVVK